jgi:hypothetical protein
VLASGRLPSVLALEIPPGGRPKIAADLRALIRQMSAENPLWGAPRVHGVLLKLGFEVAQSSVAKYMVKRCGPPSQGGRTFLRNHAPDIAAMDLFVVPTIGFDLLYVLVIVRLARRDLVWINVTSHPTAEWVARQITEAFPWNEAPRYLLRVGIGSTACSSNAGVVPWAFVIFFGKGQCGTCHAAPYYTDNLMHDLKIERFFKPAMINDLWETGDGPIKTFPLRGIKDSPPYMHDGRLLTLDDTVELFNLILGTKLTGNEK